MKVTEEQLYLWRQQIVVDKLHWLTNKKEITNPKEIEAYTAGLRHGMQDLIGTLKLHKVI